MNAINRVIELLNNVSGSFYNAYLETRGWIYPFSSVAIFFYGLSSLFASVSWQLYNFSQWVSYVTDRIANILSYENIASHFKSFFNMASEALEWVRGAFKNVTNIIDTWWSEARLTVQSWVDTARQALQSNLDAANKIIGSIQETISDLKGKIPTVNEVQTWITSLLATKIKELEPFWAGWQEMKSQVVEFFTDPGKWFMDRIEGWLERFW